MTLKKCAVTRLTPGVRIYHVDIPGDAGFAIQVYRTADTFLAEATGSSTRFHYSTEDGAIDSLLTSLGFTRYDPKPETAEERVRAAVDMSEPPLRADLCAILAELDRVRETSEALHASLRAANAVAQHAQDERNGLSKELDGVRISNDRLRMAVDLMQTRHDKLCARPPVDIESVLAPIRSRVSAWEERCANLALSRDGHMAKRDGLSPNYTEAGLAEVQRWSFMVAADSLRGAIAEAEKIGRG